MMRGRGTGSSGRQRHWLAAFGAHHHVCRGISYNHIEIIDLILMLDSS